MVRSSQIQMCHGTPAQVLQSQLLALGGKLPTRPMRLKVLRAQESRASGHMVLARLELTPL